MTVFRLVLPLRECADSAVEPLQSVADYAVDSTTGGAALTETS